MSDGNGQVPSRRALRQRRVEAESRPQSTESSPESSSVVPKPKSAVDPLTEVSAPAERESQARARSRDTLRVYKSLAEPSNPVEAAPPTRRQLRTRRAGAAEGNSDPGTDPRAETSQSAGSAPPDNDMRAETAAEEAKAVEAPLDTDSVAAGGGRRERRQMPESSLSASHGDASHPERMSVEQALAAREALIGQAQNQAAALASQQQEDPFSVDLAVLAEQKALAERAAVLNRRADNMERLARENEQARSERNDPTTAHNLGTIAPTEYARRPGVDRSVTLRTSGTTHIPVVTGGPPPVRLSGPAKEAVVPAVLPLSAAGASGTESGSEPEDAGPMAGPIGAKTAYGLDPLDAVTAAGARIQGHLLMQMAVIALGAAAIVFGMLMIFGGVGR